MIVKFYKKKAEKKKQIYGWSYGQKQKAILFKQLFDQPLLSPLGDEDGMKYGGHLHYVRLVNKILIEKSPSNTNLIDIDNIIQKNKEISWFDYRLYDLAKQPYNMEAIPFLAKSISGNITGKLGLSKKVLVVDLDNTLWGGIIGDDGLDGIILSNNDPNGKLSCVFKNFEKVI